MVALIAFTGCAENEDRRPKTKDLENEDPLENEDLENEDPLENEDLENEDPQENEDLEKEDPPSVFGLRFLDSLLSPPKNGRAN